MSVSVQWYPREEGYRSIGSLAAGAMLLAVDMLGVVRHIGHA